MKKAWHYIWRVLVGLIAILVVIVIGYVGYMQAHYYRIKDNKVLAVHNNQNSELVRNKSYSAMTYNVGFGAYDQKYSFFMDTGEMKDGTKTQGKYGTAKSKSIVLKDTNGVIQTVKKENPDFMLFQEIDTNSTRSFHVNQVQRVENSLNDYGNVFANNFHSAFLFYPFNNPHGAVQSGLFTLSKYNIQSAMRRKYYITSKFITKFTDLDRCFVVLTIPVKGGHKLILINSHMSAYDKGGTSRKKQLKLLSSVMRSEYEKGNYVICGGDFNHALGRKYLHYFKSAQKVPSWVSVLTQKQLNNSKMKIVTANNASKVPTCRGTDIPYKKNYTYTTVVDGFLVSPNVKASAKNINTNFAYADHNPVKLTFSLK